MVPAAMLAAEACAPLKPVAWVMFDKGACLEGELSGACHATSQGGIEPAASFNRDGPVEGTCACSHGEGPAEFSMRALAMPGAAAHVCLPRGRHRRDE